MKKAGVFLLLLLLTAALAVGGWWFYQGILDPLLRQSSDSFSALDTAIAEKNWSEVKALLTHIPHTFSSVKQGLSFVKRALALGRSPEKDWNPYLKIIGDLKSTFPGNQEVLALETYGFLRSGNKKLAQDNSKSLEAYFNNSGEGLDPVFKSLKSEIDFRYEISYEENTEDWDFRRLESALNSVNVDPELYAQVQSLISHPGVLQNTLLSFLREGNYTRVLSYLDRGSSEILTPDMKALVYFDVGEWEKALKVLNSLEDPEANPMVYPLLADIQLLLSGPEAASVIYMKMITPEDTQVLKPYQKSALPYLNMATFLELQQSEYSVTQALKYLRQIDNRKTPLDEMTPETKILKDLFLLELEYLKGDKEKVHDSLFDPESSTDKEVLRYRLFPDYLSLPRLFTLFRQSSSGVLDRVTEFLVWQLILAQNYTQALDVLDQWENRVQQKSWWTHYYRSIVLALQGNYSLAIESFSLVDPKWQDFSYYFNKGLVYFTQNTKETTALALQSWELARSYLGGTGTASHLSNDRAFSRLYYFLAKTQENLGQKTWAQKYSFLAWQLDNENFQAYFLNQRLKDTGENLNDTTEE